MTARSDSGPVDLGSFDSPLALPEPWNEEPYLLSNHGYSAMHRAWATPGALLVQTSGTGRKVGLLGLGDPGAVARLLHEVTPEVAAEVRWVTVPRGTFARSAEVLAGPLAHMEGHGEWDWMWTETALQGTDPEGVERLEVGDPEVDEFLAVAHPSTDTDTADPRLFGWWGLRDGSALVAVVGALRFAPGLPPYLVSVATHPEYRGRGLAGRVMAAAVRDGLAGANRVGRGVSLALYASNDRARRVYLRHGFELRHEFESLRKVR